jgi:ABC-type Fe3+-siderophore transport system permease subunit
MAARALRAFSNTSYRELGAWASLIVTGFVYVPYFSWVLQRFLENRLAADDLLGVFLGAVFTQIFFLVGIHVALAILLKEEPRDERDRIIDAKSSHLAYNILSILSVVAAVWIVIGGVASASVPEVVRHLQPILLSQVFLFLCILAETVKYLTQGICYRRGS